MEPRGRIRQGRQRTCALALIALVGSCFTRAQPVVIPDPALEGVVRETLEWWTEPLTAEVMSRLVTLDASRRSIGSLEGLAAAHNLQLLDLNFNLLSPPSVPAGLGSLSRLLLRGNGLSSLVLPADLVNLVVLDLSENQVTEVSFLERVPALRSLELEYNDLGSLALPPGLTNLLRLNLTSNRLTNFAFLDGLPQLEELFLEDNLLRSFPLPQHLTNLTMLGRGSRLWGSGGCFAVW